MASNRHARRRVFRRDKGRCGIHLGGCGKEITDGEPYNRDHIIPRSLFSKVAGDRLSEFDQDWNCQPMHVACNQSKSFSLEGWPEFRCRCHYLQVVNGDLYICTRGKIGSGQHKLLAGVVSEHPERVDARLVFGTSSGPGGQQIAGYHRGRFGYILPGIAARQVEMFNFQEQARVGLPTPRLIYLDEQGHVTPVNHLRLNRMNKEA